jgi:hypothetical protein
VQVKTIPSGQKTMDKTDHPQMDADFRRSCKSGFGCLISINDRCVTTKSSASTGNIVAFPFEFRPASAAGLAVGPIAKAPSL